MRLVIGLTVATLASIGVLAAPAEATCLTRTAGGSLRAGGDCAPEERYDARAGVLRPAAASTVISSRPVPFATTDGDILAVTAVSGARRPTLAIGGNFSTVITRDGVRHPARNFALLDEESGALRHAGRADSYVRAITTRHGVTYLGGDFTSVGGHRRAHAAALSPSGQVTAWNPAPAARVRGMTADDGGVYLTGEFGAVRKVSLRHGRPVWSRPTTAGSGRVLKIVGGWLYAGGLFETYDGTARHGLVKIDPGSGRLVRGFDARLRSDSGAGDYGGYDGEGVLALGRAPGGRLLVGIGGRAPAGLDSNLFATVDPGTGDRVWTATLIGDCQAVATAGRTVVAGYHRNGFTTDTPSPEFAAQFTAEHGSWTSWDPRLTGTQANADGGNNGVQAMYADAARRTLFVAGAFTDWNGTPRQSLAAFRW